MNLELFKSKNAQPSDSWWERLFNAHGSIAFDDYDKDFTDLPAPLAEVRFHITGFDKSLFLTDEFLFSIAEDRSLRG
jgi:hypothetical protein